ncbi:solute carrier family 2, facilitated glucose transporter member 7-like isoform 2-T2 [Liasis olivaceus]
MELSKLLVCSVLICSVVSLHFGFNSWILYSSEVLIYLFFNVSTQEELADPSSQMFLLQLVIDFFPLGGLVGSLLSGYLGDTFGRKGSLVINNVLTIISTILVGSDKFVYVYELTICIRLFTGICAGANFCLVLVYLCEISPRSMRGRIIIITDLCAKLGNLIALILSFPEILGHPKGWYVLIILNGIIPVVMVFLIPYLPESPRYLLIQKGDEETARTVLKELKESGDVEEEMEDLQQEDLSEKEEKKLNLIQLVQIPRLWWQLISAIVIMAGSQLVGFHAVYHYSYKIFLGTQMGYNSMKYLSAAVGIIICLSSLLGIYLVDHVGRKILLLIGLAICTASSILMVIVLEILEYKIANLVLSYLNFILYIVFLSGHTIGPKGTWIILLTPLLSILCSHLCLRLQSYPRDQKPIF